jgi:hypothetical protein
MSNYTKTTNFLAKDSLPDTDTAKIIRGSEFDTEFNNLVVAVASKANIISPALTGIPTTPTAAAGTNTLQIASTAFVTGAVTTATSSLSTMSTQAANAVAITGGSATGMTALTGTTVTASTTLAIGAGWTAVQSGTDLIFKYSGVNKMKIDSSGNLTVTGDITAFGTV